MAHPCMTERKQSIRSIRPKASVRVPAANEIWIAPYEVRWAFMRRVHQDYAARVRMSAADALPETLKSAFRCG